MLHKINKDFDKLTEEELIEILNQGRLSEEEFESLVKAMKAKGLSGTIMTVEDPDSEEAKASIEYIEYHKKLAKNYYKNMPVSEIKWANEVLFLSKASLEDKKRALLILAHTGDIEAYKILEKYERNPDPKLKIWINLAIQECQSFLQKEILGQPVISVGKVTKVGRNEPCPCGSGKKYKKCHGK